MLELIIKKRDGHPLEKEEIDWFVSRYTGGEIPDYQVSALLMAIFFQGMNDRETRDLTMAMAYSGDCLKLDGIRGIKVDKHSTGGVGDKVTLIVAPIAASLGVPVAKMSGRGLGFTGGTIDKLESIPGFRTDLSEKEFEEFVNRDGIAIMGQTAELAPADKVLYALRDVTGTVDNMSLIASSIMSKKIAAGADAIVLDVTCGQGAFMKKEEDARLLGEKMVEIGKLAGLNTRAVITDMEEPLGRNIGNALEVQEAIDVLKGGGPEDTVTVCTELAAQMLLAGEITDSYEKAVSLVKESIESGKALEKLEILIRNQGGDPEVLKDYSRFKTAPVRREFKAEADGYLQRIICDSVGNCVKSLGGGREVKEQEIDPSVGLTLLKKTGDRVEKGETIAVIHAADEEHAGRAEKDLREACIVGTEKPEKRPLIYGIIQ